MKIERDFGSMEIIRELNRKQFEELAQKETGQNRILGKSRLGEERGRTYDA